MSSKAEAWDLVGSMFWELGRVSARPSQTELDVFVTAVEPGERCTVIGASTKGLVEALSERGAQVTVLDFSERMCADLRDALSAETIDVRCHDIVRPAPRDLAGTQNHVLSDRLINRFSIQEAVAGLTSMLELIASGGQLRASVKLGNYPMDDRMIALGQERGTLSDFYDEQSRTIDFSTAGEILQDALVRHGDIPREVLLNWYRGRGKEQRFSDASVRAAIGAALDARQASAEIKSLAFPDAPETKVYSVRPHFAG